MGQVIFSLKFKALRGHKQDSSATWIFIKKEEQLSFKLVRPPIGSKTGSTYRYLWPVIREGVAFAPAQRPPPLHFMAYRF